MNSRATRPDLHPKDRILPNAVEERMDAFRIELKQWQAEVLQQTAMATSHFDAEYVDKHIEETSKQLTIQFKASISAVRKECRNQIEAANKSIEKMGKKLIGMPKRSSNG